MILLTSKWGLGIFSLKIYIVVTVVVIEVTYSCKSVNTRVVITLLLHDVMHGKQRRHLVVTVVVIEVTYSCKSVNTRVVITLLLHDVMHGKQRRHMINDNITIQTRF